jgi:hypothetical protein
LWGEQNPEEYRINLGSIPLKYLGDPHHDIGPGASSLRATTHYLTGTTLMLDGGRGYLR